MKRTPSNSFFRVIFLLVLCTLGISSNLSAQTWSSVESGGINISSAVTMYNPQLQTFNGNLYAVWIESGKVRVKRYDGGTTWTIVDGGGKYWNSAACANLTTAVYNNALYMSWQEDDTETGGITRIHALKYDGTTFTFVQSHTAGSADDGKHYVSLQQTQYAYSPALGIHNGKLYASWIEGTNATFNYQVHVSEFDGTYWKSVDGGNVELGLNRNYSGILLAEAPHLTMASYGNNLYVSWRENSTVIGQYQFRVKRFDGGSTWTFVDGNAEAGLNYNSANDPLTPRITSCNGYLYAIWSEATVEDPGFGFINQIRVKKYDGSGWTYADGGTAYGWNKGQTLEYMAAAYNPSAFAYNNQLYVAWDEAETVNWVEQIRAVKYDGTTKTFIDGNGTNGINQNTSNKAQMPFLSEYNGELYAGWQEGTPYLFRIKKYALQGITTSVTVPANATYKISDALNFTVNFNKNVNVAGGTPYIPITLNTGGTVNATYQSGTGTKALLFRYTVAAGNADPDGITVGSSIVLPGGCTLRDASSLDASLTLNSVGSTTAVLVDGIAPVVSSINWQSPATSPTNATSLVYRVTFSKSVSNVDISDFTLTKTATATGTIASVTSSSGTTIDVTVNAVSGYGTLRLDLNSSGTGIIDIPGNAISGGFTSGQAYSIYGASTATTNAASSITTTDATLNGTINANNASTTVTFDYGLDTSYGSSVTATQSPATGTSNTSVSASLSGLTPNTTYHYRVKGVNTGGTTNGLDGSFTTTAAATSTFQSAGNWSLASNWSAGIPGSTTEATISANCTVDGNFTTANLTISATASLTVPSGNTLNVVDLDLESDNNGTGSLINNGTLNVSGTTTAQRYMTGSKWHIVSPTVAGGSISSFIQATGNSIPVKNVSDYGMMDYDETGNGWKAYFTTGTAGNLIAGKGYSLRRSANGTVAFTGTGAGTLTNGNKPVTLTKLGSEGWNCVGNPYPSAIGINTDATSAENLITKNFGILDASYACVYVWDEDATYSGQNCYKILSNTGFSLPSGKTRLSDNYVAPGQGFFVKTAANNNTLQFTALMQSHQATMALKSAKVSWPGFQLTTTTAEAKASTIITFNSAMTNGLDVTYDAGLLRGTSGLELYSRLVNDNGVDFAIQCLPESYNLLVIPLGVESKTGGEITFSAETVELPTACSVILEDKLAKTFTSLAGGATYKATVSVGTTAVGRFYIHTNSSTTATSQLSAGAFSLKAYPANGHIWIIGEVAPGAKASLFDVNGRNLGTFNLQEGNRNSISSEDLAPGVYLLNVTQAEKRFNTKIVIY